MIKALSILGARPQFIKAAVVSRNISEYSGITEKIIHTGQHFDTNMSDIFFEQMEIPKPDYNLNINSLSHGEMTGQMISKLEPILISENPDIVIVYGDTNTTLAGAVTAKKLNLKLAHIEAGLRSFNMNMPEEVNRIIADRISDKLYCPTQTAVNNLIKEGFENLNCSFINSGDVMYDAVLHYSKKAGEYSNIINDLKLNKDEYILLTLHRQENTDDLYRFKLIATAINELSEKIKIVFPIHPRTKKLISEFEIKLSPNLILTEPVGYFEMLQLISNSRLVMTDSGGLQKEAFFLRKFCITLRDETEWTELIDAGVNKLCGASKEKIIEAYSGFADRKFECHEKFYGNGNSGKIIVEDLISNDG